MKTGRPKQPVDYGVKPLHPYEAQNMKGYVQRQMKTYNFSNKSFADFIQRTEADARRYVSKDPYVTMDEAANVAASFGVSVWAVIEPGAHKMGAI